MIWGMLRKPLQPSDDSRKGTQYDHTGWYSYLLQNVEGLSASGVQSTGEIQTSSFPRPQNIRQLTHEQHLLEWLNRYIPI